MAIYRCELRIIGRGTGRSAVNASAYRNGRVMTDERTGMIHDHDRKERVDHSEVMLPAGAPAWARDPSTLWNSLEAHERRCDAQLAREVTVAIPHELPFDAGVALIRRFSRSQFVANGYAVEASIHGFKRSAGRRNGHAHIMATERMLGPTGWAGTKDRSRNRLAQIYTWRQAWADHANEALREIGCEARIDHRRTEDQVASRTAEVAPELTAAPVTAVPSIAPDTERPAARMAQAQMASFGWAVGR